MFLGCVAALTLTIQDVSSSMGQALSEQMLEFDEEDTMFVRTDVSSQKLVVNYAMLKLLTSLFLMMFFGARLIG